MLTPTKPSVATRNIAPAIMPLPPEGPAAATKTIEPTLPSIGRAIISAPPAPSCGASSGGAWRTSCPPGIVGGSSLWPRPSVVDKR